MTSPLPAVVPAALAQHVLEHLAGAARLHLASNANTSDAGGPAGLPPSSWPADDPAGPWRNTARWRTRLQVVDHTRTIRGMVITLRRLTTSSATAPWPHARLRREVFSRAGRVEMGGHWQPGRALQPNESS